ncbi:MAG: ABC transporter substrate-binding protein [Gallionella sp.]|nr:ABC transporter substrate-binding protein [Gallionella sp.]
MMRQAGYKLAWLVAMLFVATPSFALDRVVLQLKWVHAFQFAGYYAAKEQGYYRDVGLDVSLVEASGKIDPVREVLDGRAQYGIGTSSLLLSRVQGLPVVALAVIFQQSPYEIYAAPEIRSLRDLIGKRIMLEPQSAEVLAYLKKEGISSDQIRQIPHSFDANGLMKGEAEAIAGYISDEPFYFRQANYPYQTFSPRSAGIDFYGDNLFTSGRELQEHPARVKAFRAASLRGWQYAKEHRDEVIDLILAKYSTQHGREYLRFESDQMIPLLQPNLIEIGYMNPNRWRDIADTYADIGMMPRNFSLAGFLYDPGPKPQDLTWLYRALVVMLLLVGVSVLIALHIYGLNRKLRGSERQNLIIREKLQQAWGLAEQALAEKGQFMDMLAHELKTPLSVIRMVLGSLPPAQPLLAHAERAVHDMSNVIERCLYAEKFSGQQPINLSSYPLHDKLQELRAGSMMPERLVIHAEISPVLETDGQLLHCIISNLIDNAIKYSPPLSPVQIVLMPDDRPQGGGVSLEIRNLPGLAGLPDPDKVFQKYYRSRAAHHQTGSGLGLYLVRSMAGRLGGEVSYLYDDEMVKFKLWLPL